MLCQKRSESRRRDAVGLVRREIEGVLESVFGDGWWTVEYIVYRYHLSEKQDVVSKVDQ